MEGNHSVQMGVLKRMIGLKEFFYLQLLTLENELIFKEGL